MVKTPLEDFTTEILAGIFDNNPEICSEFVNKVLNIEGDGFSVSTQDRFLLADEGCPDCRVDLVFKSIDTICFMENKVESKEGYIQLERYGMVLDNYKLDYKTNLRYCTKYHDYKDIRTHNFSQLRWADIYRFLKKWETLTIIKEYLDFLDEYNMSDNMDFDFNDLIALNELNQVIKKLDNYLDKIKPIFNKTLGYRLKDISQLKQIREHSRYILLMDVPFGTNGYSELGFGFKFSETPSLTVWIWCSENSDRSDRFKTELNNQNLNKLDSNKENWIGLSKPLSDFLSFENMDIEIENWFKDSFIAIRDFATLTPALDWNLR